MDALAVRLASIERKLDDVLALLAGRQASGLDTEAFLARVRAEISPPRGTRAIQPGDAAALSALVPAIVEALGPQQPGGLEFTVAGALAALRVRSPQALCALAGDAPRTLGRLLARSERRAVGAYHIERAKEKGNRVVWRLVSISK